MDATDTALAIALVHARGVCAPESSSFNIYRLGKWELARIDRRLARGTGRRLARRAQGGAPRGPLEQYRGARGE